MKTGREVPVESTSDICLYIQDAFKNIAEKPRAQTLPTDWPRSDVEKELAERAGGVFIWAVTALEFIAEGDPVKRLAIIRVGRLPGGGVHALYKQILETTFPSNAESLLFVKLASAVIAAQKYLTAEDWARLLRMDAGTIKGIHRMLRTVVVDEGIIRFRHQSFVDFLLEFGDTAPNQPESGCPKRFRVDVSEAHHTLARVSFLLMNRDLGFNTCSIDSSYFPIKRVSSETCVNAVTPALAYVCEFWKFHLQRLRPSDRIDISLILRFLQEKTLYWVESLSVLGRLNIAVGALDVLQQYLMPTNVSFNQTMSHMGVLTIYVIRVIAIKNHQ